MDRSTEHIPFPPNIAMTFQFLIELFLFGCVLRIWEESSKTIPVKGMLIKLQMAVWVILLVSIAAKILSLAAKQA